MQNEEPTLGAVLKEFNLTSDESKRLAVSVLSLIHEAKKAGVPLDGAEAPPTPPVKDVLFELAKLHVNTVAQVARLNAGFTDQMVTFLRARRKRQEHCKPDSQQVVFINEAVTPPENGILQIANPSKTDREYTLPAMVELVELGTNPGAYAQMTYTPAGNTLRVGAGATATVTVALGKTLLDTGRYRANTIVDCKGGPSIELIIELKKK